MAKRRLSRDKEIDIEWERIMEQWPETEQHMAMKLAFALVDLRRARIRIRKMKGDV